MCINTFTYYIYTFPVISFVTIVNCKTTKFYSSFILFLPGLLLSISFVVLGSSLCGSTLDQWLFIHLIGHNTTFSHVLFKWSVVSTMPFFHFISSVHESSLMLGYCDIRGGVRLCLPAFHGGGFTYRACSFVGRPILLALLVALGVAFGSTLPVKRSLG